MFVLDPGHGGHDAIGKSTPRGSRCPDGSAEKDFNLALAQRVSQLYRGAATLTRSGDYNLSLADRIHTASQCQAKAFVSIHSSPQRHGGRDSQVWVHARAGAESLALARALAQTLDGGSAVVRQGELGVLAPERFGGRVAACMVDLSHPASYGGNGSWNAAARVEELAPRIAQGLDHYTRVAMKTPRFGAQADNLFFNEKREYVSPNGKWWFYRYVRDDDPDVYGIRVTIVFYPKAPIANNDKIVMMQAVKRVRKGKNDLATGKLKDFGKAHVGYILISKDNLAIPHATDNHGHYIFIDASREDVSPIYHGQGNLIARKLYECLPDGKSCEINVKGYDNNRSVLKDTPSMLIRPKYPTITDLDQLDDGPAILGEQDLTGYKDGALTGQFFETVALRIGPKDQNPTYLGSVSWGWHLDGSGDFQLLPLEYLGANPTPFFVDAARAWNEDIGIKVPIP